MKVYLKVGKKDMSSNTSGAFYSAEKREGANAPPPANKNKRWHVKI
jgi:hypothetical protein